MEPIGGVLFHHSKLTSTCFKKFAAMKEDGRFCDITFRFGNRTVLAHRLVLAASIPYFNNMFHRPEEGRDLMDLIMKEIHPHALESLINFAYSGKILITSKNVKMVLKASWMLDMEEVREACCDFLVSQLHPQNVLIIRDMAEELCCSSLVDRCDHYVCQNFDRVVDTEYFSNTPLYFIKKLLASDSLKTRSEEKVFESVMKWIKKSPNVRKDKLPDLLSNVRMALLSPDYLKDHVMEEMYIRESIPCRDIIDKVKFYHLLPHRSIEFSGSQTLPRIYTTSRTRRSTTGTLYTICKEVKHKILRLDTNTGKWTTIETTPFTQLGTVVGHENRLYFMDYDSLRIYEPPKRDCVTGGTYCPAKISVGAAVLNNRLYICGGQHRDTVSRRVEYVDLEMQKSVRVTSMSVSRSLHGLVSLNGYLYAIGGGNEDCVHDSVERFDPGNKEWDMVSPMNTRRYGLGCAAMDGKIYVSGGISSLKSRKCLASAEVYDPLINEWRNISSMNEARYYSSLVAHCGKLYAIGGYDELGTYMTSVEIYSPETDTWSSGSPIDSTHTNVRAVEIPFSGN